MIAMREWHEQGKLNRDQALVFAQRRPGEELYDLKSDPHELHNLAGDVKHQETLEELRATLEAWIEKTGDQGQFPEPDAMFDSDMKVYVDKFRDKDGELTAHGKAIAANIALMKKWQAEGK